MKKIRNIKSAVRAEIGYLLAVGLSTTAQCQSPTADRSAEQASGRDVQEVLVTATRRTTSVTEIPYNISTIGGGQLENLNVTDVSDLVQALPGVSLSDTGAKYTGTAGQFLVIRGLNGSSGALSGSSGQGTLGQAPVATFYGDIPLFAYFPITDLNRIEVLRGPQGTLFGVGSLAGAIRFIPNDPSLNEFSGNITADVASTDHASNADYRVDAVLNVPVGEVAALRVVGGTDYQAGFIDDIARFKRTSSNPLAPVVQTGNLASPPVLDPASDVNWQRTSYGRVALLLKPADSWKITATVGYMYQNGGDANADNPTWPGGPYASLAQPPPGIVIPATGEYQQANTALQPWNRNTVISGLGIDVDLGFGTVISQTSYFDAHGSNWINQSALDGRRFGYYYQGAPRFPGWIGVYGFDNSDRGISQELRVVSKTGTRFEYIVGAYYSDEKSSSNWKAWSLEGQAWKDFSGSPYPWSFIQDDQVYVLANGSTVKELSEFGEITYHLAERWQVTAGGRHYDTKSESSLDFVSTTPIGGVSAGGTNNSEFTGWLFKGDTSFEFLPAQRLYATWSQGLRRGGANAFPLTGIYAEPAALIPFKPDTVDNAEGGVKGRVLGKIEYTADIFYDILRHTQIQTSTPGNGWPVVINGGDAQSKGFELELDAELARNWRGTVGMTYADAQFTQDFAVPTAYGVISGESGVRLPMAPKVSALMSVTYQKQHFWGEATLDLTASATYKGPQVFDVPRTDHPIPPSAGGYTLVNLNGQIAKGKLDTILFVNNLTNKRAVLGQLYGDFIDTRADAYFVNRPLTIGLRLRYHF